MSDDAHPSAGRLLRKAREKQGLHVAALAASIKVPVKKLEALEADRHDQLPDATFARALALTVCRALKADPAPILDLLPKVGNQERLAQVSQGLNTPFRERPPGLLSDDFKGVLGRPALWLTALVLGATLVLYFFPGSASRLAGLVAVSGALPAASAGVGARPAEREVPAPVTASAADATTTPAAPAEAASPALQSVEVPVPISPAPASSGADSSFGAAGEGVLQFRVAETSWVEVVDARGVSLVARLLVPGESVGVDGQAPFRVRIGNAAATQVAFRGQPTDLQPYTRDNVARLELK